jgi:hypothetical protein
LTTEKNDSIPSSLIERSFKVVCETPTGQKENIKKTLIQWEEAPSTITETNRDNHLRTKLFFILAWIHATIQERGSFGPQGWSQMYDFTSGDLLAAECVIETFHDNPNKVEIIQFFLVHFVYGGKMSNHIDETILKVYVEKYLSQDILEGNAELFSGFTINRSWDDQSHHRAIRKIPTIVSPSLFGLPRNIYRSVNNAMSISLGLKLQKLNSNSLDHGTHQIGWCDAVKPIIQEWTNLTNGGQETEMHDSGSNYADDNFQQFLQTEILLCRRLYTTVSESISLLKQAINDDIDLESISFQQLRDCLVSGLVPISWEELWNGPSNPIVWIREMIKKKKALHIYERSSDVFVTTGSMIKLSDFFNISAFLYAMRQKVAREKCCSMDDVTLFAHFESPHEQQNSAEGGHTNVSTCGLFLRGCLLDEKRDRSEFMVLPVKPDTPEYQISPCIRINFLEPSTFQLNYLTKTAESILIPVYANTSSEEQLFQVSVSCEKGETSSWKLTGVALYLEC